MLSAENCEKSPACSAEGDQFIEID